MRELKFRAYHKYMQKMLVPVKIHLENGKVTCFETLLDDNVYQVKIDDKEYGLHIMQYTGLKDKNGKEIYEGDIIQFNWYGVDYKGCIKYGLYDIYTSGGMSFIGETIGRYISDKNGKILIDDTQETILLTYRLTPIIIGNIYENPELLN